jgi:hypothetical protein
MQRVLRVGIGVCWLAIGLAACGGSSGTAAHSSTKRSKHPAIIKKAVQVQTPRPFAADRPADVGLVVSPHTTGGQIVASDGFQLGRDGFSFENYGFIAGPELTSADMRMLFGNGVCAGTPSDNCTLTPAAQGWAQEIDDGAMTGHCFGFSMTVLAFFKHYLNPSEFGGSTVYSLQFTTQIESEIAYSFALQAVQAVRQSEVKLTPDQDLTFLEKALANPNGPVYTAGIFDSEGGHAVTPIAIENDGGGQYAIDIYDNNYPDTPRAISINTNDDSWSYQESPNPQASSSLAQGQGNTNPIILFPLDKSILAQHPCPFCGGASANSLVSISLAGDPTSHGHLLITNSKGQHIGYLNGVFVNQIPGAHAIQLYMNEDWLAHPEPLYEVPGGSHLTVSLNGDGAVNREDAAVDISGVGYGARVSNLQPQAGETEQIGLSPLGGQLSIKQLGSAPSDSPTVQLLVNHGSGGSELSVTPTAIGAGTQLTVGVSDVSGRVQIASAGPHASLPVAVALKQIVGGAVNTSRRSVSLKGGRQTRLSLNLNPVS